MTNQEYEKKLQELQTEIDELKAFKPTEYKRWRAKSVGRYYFLAHNGSPRDCTDSKAPFDNYCYNTGNYFKTVKEAEQHKAYLLALQTIKDDAEGFAPDWEDENQEKYHGYYNHEANELNIGWSLAFQYQGVVYFQAEKKLRHSLITHEAEWLTVLGVEQ